MGLGGAYVFAPMLKSVIAEFGWSRAAFAWAGSSVLISMSLASPLIGSLTDRYGARRVVASSALLLCAAFWLFSAVESLWQFWLVSFLLGFSLAGLGDIPVGALAARWFVGGRALALGIVYSGSNIGGFLVTLVVTAVAAQASWRASFQVVGTLAFVIIVPFALATLRDAPTDITRPAEEAARDGGDQDLGLREALRTRSFWILAAVLFAFYFYYLGVNNHLFAYLTDSGLSASEAARRYGLTVLLGIGGKIGIGVLADRIPRKAALLLNFGLLSIASISLLAIDRPGVLPFFIVAHGFTVAAENVLFPLIVVECFGVRHMAQIYGVLMLALLPGGMLGPIFAGAVFDRLGSYAGAFSSFAVLNALGLLALSQVRRHVDGPA